jgi:hypothetical protein
MTTYSSPFDLERPISLSTRAAFIREVQRGLVTRPPSSCTVDRAVSIWSKRFSVNFGETDTDVTKLLEPLAGAKAYAVLPKHKRSLGALEDVWLRAEATTERLGAFSDGVFTVAITIMMLEPKPPEHQTFAPRRRRNSVRPPSSQGRGQYASVGLVCAHWKASAYQSILELAAVRRLGPLVGPDRHNCESGLVSGAVVYEPEPFRQPGYGNVLVCCSQPICDVALDL